MYLSRVWCLKEKKKNLTILTSNIFVNKNGSPTRIEWKIKNKKETHAVQRSITDECYQIRRQQRERALNILEFNWMWLNWWLTKWNKLTLWLSAVPFVIRSIINLLGVTCYCGNNNFGAQWFLIDEVELNQEEEAFRGFLLD